MDFQNTTRRNKMATDRDVSELETKHILIWFYLFI